MRESRVQYRTQTAMMKHVRKQINDKKPVSINNHNKKGKKVN